MRTTFTELIRRLDSLEPHDFIESLGLYADCNWELPVYDAMKVVAGLLLDFTVADFRKIEKICREKQGAEKKEGYSIFLRLSRILACISPSFKTSYSCDCDPGNLSHPFQINLRDFFFAMQFDLEIFADNCRNGAPYTGYELIKKGQGYGLYNPPPNYFDPG